MERCPICNANVPAMKLEAHVDACFTMLEKKEKLKQIEQDSKIAKSIIGGPAFSLSSSSTYYEEANTSNTYESYVAAHTSARLVATSKKQESMLDKLDKRRQGQPRTVYNKNVLTFAWKEQIKAHIPNRFRLGDWTLVYSTQLDPIGLYTFYTTCLLYTSPSPRD
eukprot:TRINITY_DN1746_c0_g1_i1.p1 TRINITY_DN1746_c0_g1~~TRINITY_DN1746_c0_g1_i1.p1  ORF type:complete len:165 (+),score=23.94 TRINITY_DN1746_c0_g1_i1:511-1005(+)